MKLPKHLESPKRPFINTSRAKRILWWRCVKVLTDEFAFEVEQITKENQDPITSIVLIYENGFERLKKFRPSFIFGIKKYYPSAYEVFQGFRSHIIKTVIYDLLEKAKKNGFILHEVKLDLFCDLYFNKFEEILFKDNYFIERYLDTDVFKHLIIYNLRGITVSGYDNKLLG